MSLNLDKYRALAARMRAKADPIHTVSVVVRKRTWDGGSLGEGSPTSEDVDLGKTKVVLLRAREIAESGGRFLEDAVRVGPIDPTYSAQGGGGFTVAELHPDGDDDTEIVWVLSGDVEGEYTLAHLDTSRPLRYMAVLNRMRTTP